MNAPLRHRQRRTIALSDITGPSPRNCRVDTAGDDVSGLAASIAALDFAPIQPLLVSINTSVEWDGDCRYWIDDGGRRFRALCQLRDAGRIPPDHPVDVDLIDASLDDAGAFAQQASLAANVMRRELHPVDECAAYARLVDEKSTIEAIADAFSVTTRQVRQRLKLQQLSPAVRTAWRDGRFNADAAAAFTAGAGHAAQDKLLAEIDKGGKTYDPFTIRCRLRGDALRADTSEARYVGLEAYAAAGGEIDDNLFEDFALCRDGALMKRMAREKLMAEGAAILDRLGLGSVVLREDCGADYRNWTQLPREATEAERIKLEESDEFAVLDLAARVELEMKAIARKATPDQIVKATLMLYLADGRACADVGMVAPPVKPEPDASAAGGKRRKRARADAAASIVTPPAAEPAKGNEKPLKVAIDAARRIGVHDALIEAPQLALVVAVAALQARANAGPVRIATLKRTAVPGTLPHASFSAALDQLLHDDGGRVGLPHLAEIVAEALEFGALDRDALALLAAVAGAAPDAYRKAALRAFDHNGYIGALPKDKAQKLYVQLGGTAADVKNLRRDKLTDAVLTLARDKGWLPSDLDLPPADMRARPAKAAAADEPQLAQAMDEAMSAAERKRARFQAWFAAAVAEGAGLKVKAGALFEHYRASLDDPAEAYGPNPFGKAIADRGIGKRRAADGYFYQGIALKADGEART